MGEKPAERGFARVRERALTELWRPAKRVEARRVSPVPFCDLGHDYAFAPAGAASIQL